MSELRKQFEKQFKCDKKECKDCATSKAGCKTLCRMCDVRNYYYVKYLETLLTTKYIKRSEVEGWIEKEQKRIKGMDLEDDLWKDGYAVALGNLQVEILKSKLEVKP